MPDIDNLSGKFQVLAHRCGLACDKRDFLTKAGVALFIKDIRTGETPGLESVVRSGLVAQPVESAEEAVDPTPGAPSGTAVPVG